MTGTSKDCINLGSYNYLGFAQNSGPCADAAIESVYKYGPGASSTRRELGEHTSVHIVAVSVCYYEWTTMPYHDVQ